MKGQNIRNFCIIAHVDSGKSTLADRLLEITQTIPKEKMRPQYLDQNPIARERGITIKLAPVRMKYILNSEFYILNLIDTPGHVDFSYEVSRSLAAVEAALLLVDATAGIQAQTLANFRLARQLGLTIIPVVNKIDLNEAEPEKTAKDMAESFEVAREDIIFISAKTGENVDFLLNKLINRIPSPSGNNNNPLRALIFDSQYDSFKGVLAYVRIFAGKVKRGDELLFMGEGSRATSLEVGVFKPELKPSESLSSGEIGFIATGLKDIEKVRVGDTITLFNNPTKAPISGYKEVKPMVFAAFYPEDNNEFELLRDALLKLKLNDAALVFDPEYSEALGSGFRVGFLGLLHREIVKERLEREYKLSLITSFPTVEYEVLTTKNEILRIKSPNKLPDPSQIKQMKEPFIKGRIIAPKEYIGAVLELVSDKRGEVKNIDYEKDQTILEAYLALSQVIIDFYDRLKSISSGFASFDWEFFEMRVGEFVRLDIFIAREKVDALSQIVLKDKAYSLGRSLVDKLADVISRQQFEVAIQASISGKIIASAKISPFRKDVTAKLYGGDRSRKDKLLEAQKKGKRRMKMVGHVEIPQEAFLKILS